MARVNSPAPSPSPNPDPQAAGSSVDPGASPGVVSGNGSPAPAGAGAPPDQSDDTRGATTPPTSTLDHGGSIAPIDDSGELCPSGNPDDPFGPSEEAPFGYYRSGEKAGQPKTSAAGRPPKRSPRDAPDANAKPTASDAARLSVARKAGPRKPAPITAAQPVAVAVDYEAMGQACAGMWFAGGGIIFGDDWAPNVEQREHILIAHAFRDYCRSKAFSDLPPGVALAFALTTYTVVRLNKPTMKTRALGMWAGVRKGMSWLATKARLKTS